MRPINQPLVHSADLVASSPHSNDTQTREARSPCVQHHHHVRQSAIDDKQPGERRPDAMYAQNGDAAADGGHALARPPLLTSPPVKRRRSEDGERTKRAARGDTQRGCESDSGLPSGGQALASHHHHHHHHHKKTTGGSDGADQAKGDLHGVCTLEEGSLKLKISLHRPHAVTPDGLSAAKPPGDKAASSRPPSPPSLAKPEAEERAARHSPAPPDSPAAADSAVRKVSRNVCCDSNQTLDAVSSESVFVPLTVRKVALPRAPTSDVVASELSTKDSPLTPVLNTSNPFPNSAVKTNTQALSGLPPRHTSINTVSNTASSTLSKTAIPKVPLSEPNTDFLPSSKLSGTHAIPKELVHRMDTGASTHNAMGGRSLPRKSTTPGHYVPYKPPQNRRRLIQDTSKLKCKMRGHTDLPALQPLDSMKSPQTFHHVHVSVGQNGGRGFVNHDSILDHPSVHARMFPSGSPPPARLAALLNSSRPQGSSGSRQPVAQSKAGTSSEHQPLDLSRTVTKATVPRVSCLGQGRPNYVPPIGLFYMRSGSRQRLDSIIKKLWAKHNSSIRGRPRP
ncbi:uncharacterized protein LOC144098461 [Amblyomma americanum]